MTKAQHKVMAGMSIVRRTLSLSGPGYAELLLPDECPEGIDPLVDYKEWCSRVVKNLGGRAPGNWRTKRGKKKRIKWLLTHFPAG